MSATGEEFSRLMKRQQYLLDELEKVRAELWDPQPTDPPRIALRPDVRGEDPMDGATLLDDIYVNTPTMFRAEQMERRVWWVCCYLNSDVMDRIAWDVRYRNGRIEWTTIEYPDLATYEDAQ